MAAFDELAQSLNQFPPIKNVPPLEGETLLEVMAEDLEIQLTNTLNGGYNLDPALIDQLVGELVAKAVNTVREAQQLV